MLPLLTAVVATLASPSEAAGGGAQVSLAARASVTIIAASAIDLTDSAPRADRQVRRDGSTTMVEFY